MSSEANWLIFWELQNSWATKSSYETDLYKMTSLFELLTQEFS